MGLLPVSLASTNGSWTPDGRTLTLIRWSRGASGNISAFKSKLYGACGLGPKPKEARLRDEIDLVDWSGGDPTGQH